MLWLYLFVNLLEAHLNSLQRIYTAVRRSTLVNDMDSATSDEFTPTFYIGQHESDRVRVTPELLRQAQDCNVRFPHSPYGSAQADRRSV